MHDSFQSDRHDIVSYDEPESYAVSNASTVTDKSYNNKNKYKTQTKTHKQKKNYNTTKNVTRKFCAMLLFLSLHKNFWNRTVGMPSNALKWLKSAIAAFS